MAILLTEADKERIRYHCGFLNVEPVAAITLGFPAAGEAQFMLERAMTRLIPATVGRVLEQVAILDGIECQMVDALKRLKAQKLGEITLRQNNEERSEQDMLEAEYRRWAQRLADNLGIPLNVYASRFRNLSASVNLRVVGG